MIRWLMRLGRIAWYLTALMLIVWGLGILLGNAISIIGGLQLVAVWYFWPREATRPQTWAQMYRYPQRAERGKEAE